MVSFAPLHEHGDLAGMSFSPEDIEKLFSVSTFSSDEVLGVMGFDALGSCSVATTRQEDFGMIPMQGLPLDFSDRRDFATDGGINNVELADLDLNEFWETMKPLMQTEGEATSEVTDAVTTLGVDPARLAQDLQDLYSGCIL